MSYVNYWKPRLTSAEAYRAVRYFLLKCHDVSKDEYIEWLALALETDPAIMGDWKKAVQEVLEDRATVGNKYLVNSANKFPVYRDCDCWDKQIEAYHKAINYKSKSS